MSSKAKSLSEDSHFNGVNNVYIVIFSLLLIDQQVWGISLGTGPSFPLVGGFCLSFADDYYRLMISYD
jgi:hypothetical protein